MPRRSHPIFPILFLLFSVFIVAELWILVLLTKATSLGFTILVTIGSAIVGVSWLKHKGMAALRRAQMDLAQGRLPGQSLADGLVVLLGGALLIVPGLLSDLIGLTTLLPFCRRFYAKILINWAKRNLRAQGTGAGPGVFTMFTNGSAPPGATPTPGPVHSGPTHAGPTSPDDAPSVRILDPDRDKRLNEWREQIRDGGRDDDATPADVIDADFEDESKG